MSTGFLKIGNVKIKKTAALAPMASVADSVYRSLCKSFGAAYVVGEMVSVKGLCFNEKLSEAYLKISSFERPMAVQLFGSESKYFEMAMEKVLKFKPDVVDLNMGCPVNKVVKCGAGCELMNRPELAEQIVLAVVKSSKIPVTVKIRAGWDETSVNAVDFAKRMEFCGASAVTIHARTREQFYSGKSDWNLVAQVKKNLKIPVIASGDVVDVLSAKRLYDETGADLIMVGRGSFGKPWLFKQIAAYLEKGELLEEPSFEEKMKTMLQHIKNLCEFYGEEPGMKKARFHAINYFYSFKNAAKLRQKSSQLKTYLDAVSLVELAKNLKIC